MGVNLTIRKARPTDAEAVAQVICRGRWRDTYPLVLPARLLSSMTVEGQGARWRNAIAIAAREAVYVAEDDKGKILGMASMGRARDSGLGYDAEIYTLYVDPPDDGSAEGGRTLLAGAFSALAERGHARCVIWAHAGNPARFFYEAMGGKLIAERTTSMMGVPVPEIAFGWTEARACRSQPQQLTLAEIVGVMALASLGLFLLHQHARTGLAKLMCRLHGQQPCECADQPILRARNADWLVFHHRSIAFFGHAFGGKQHEFWQAAHLRARAVHIVKFRGGETWTQRAYKDTAALPFAVERLRKFDQHRLCAAIEGVACGARQEPSHRRHIQNAAVTAARHAGSRRWASSQGAMTRTWMKSRCVSQDVSP